METFCETVKNRFILWWYIPVWPLCVNVKQGQYSLLMIAPCRQVSPHECVGDDGLMNGEFRHEGIPENIPVAFHDRPGFHGGIAEIACHLMIRSIGLGPFHVHGAEYGQTRRRRLSGEAGIDVEGVAGAFMPDTGRIADIQGVGPSSCLGSQEDCLQKTFLPRQNMGLNQIQGVGSGERPGPGGSPPPP